MKKKEKNDRLVAAEMIKIKIGIEGTETGMIETEIATETVTVEIEEIGTGIQIDIEVIDVTEIVIGHVTDEVVHLNHLKALLQLLLLIIIIIIIKIGKIETRIERDIVRDLGPAALETEKEITVVMEMAIIDRQAKV